MNALKVNKVLLDEKIYLTYFINIRITKKQT
jgi:hypothetical protein